MDKQILVKFRRHSRIGQLLIILLYVFVFLIPQSYEWLAEIPPYEQLHVISGELTYRDLVYRRKLLTGIKGTWGVLSIGCGRGSGRGYGPCLYPSAEFERFAGKSATVWWYEQPAYLFSPPKRLARLVVAGEEIVSYERSVHDVERLAKEAPWFLVVELIFFLWLVLGIERDLRRREREQQPNG